MSVFYTGFYNNFSLILIFLLQFVVMFILQIGPIKKIYPEEMSSKVILTIFLLTILFSIAYNVWINYFYAYTMMSNSFYNMNAQLIFLMIFYFAFHRKNHYFLYGILIISVSCLLEQYLFIYIRLFLLNISDAVVVRPELVCLYSLLFLILVPLKKRFIDATYYLFNSSIALLTVFYIAFFLFVVMIQSISVAKVVPSAAHDYSFRIHIPDTFVGKELLHLLAPKATIIEESILGSLPATTANMAYFLITVALILFLLLSVVRRDRELLAQKQIEYEMKQYTTSLEALSSDIRKTHHDFQNILISLGGYIYEEPLNQEKLIRYFEGVSQTFGNDYHHFLEVSSLRNIGIPEIKTLLFSKLMVANQKKIDFQLEVDSVIDMLPLDYLDLSRICGILLDNALEAAEKCPDPSVRFALLQEDNQVVIIILNSSTKEDINNYHEKEGYSSKGKHRGLGLTIVRNLIQKHRKVLSLTTRRQDNEFYQILSIQKGN